MFLFLIARAVFLRALVLSLFLSTFFSTAQACQALRLVQEGDLIFQGKGSETNRLIARSTMTWTSHVGVVLKQEGQWKVVHATPPHVKSEGLCKFIGNGGSHAVLRVKNGITPSQVERLSRDALEAVQLKIPYDTTHLDVSGKTHCSKFIHELFANQGIKIGYWQSLSSIAAEFLGSESEKQELIKKWDKKFGGMLLGGNMVTRAWAWSYKTVTPASQLRDTDLAVVSCSVSRCLEKL